MKTRNGKIAQLPKSIRNELNHRLENGKQGKELLEWLNSLPETQELITQKFDNQPITNSNLSDWRYGGFQDWRADQIREARIKRVCETGGSLEKLETGDLFENFARMAVAEMVTDLDTLQKLRGEKRADQMRNLIRDLSRLQNAYNRSRWADLAWTKYNNPNNSGTGVSPVRSAPGSASVSAASSPTATSSPTTPLVPDRAQSQALLPDEGEPKPDGNGMYVLHFTNCNCKAPCPKCHAPDSDYPHEDATRDHRYYRKYFRYPKDRHGKERFLMNFICDCTCDRCAEETIPLLPSAPCAETKQGRAALPRCPITRHADSRDESPNASTQSASSLTPLLTIPAPPAHLTDFSRRLARLNAIPCSAGVPPASLGSVSLPVPTGGETPPELAGETHALQLRQQPSSLITDSPSE